MLQQQQAAVLAATAQPAPTANELALDAPPSAANKKQRELYIGNLQVGVVTTDMIRELFNSILGNMVPDPVSCPPVLEVKPDPTGRGRFAFIELRTAALAVAALHLDKMELCGRQLNIGRPKGYVDPPELSQQAKLSAAQMFAAQVSGGPTNVVLLEGLMPASMMAIEDERRELYDDVYLEAVKCGQVAGIALPLPPPGAPDSVTCRVFVRYATQEGAAKCKAVMDGRQFDDNKIRASYVTEQDFYRAHAGEWL